MRTAPLGAGIRLRSLQRRSEGVLMKAIKRNFPTSQSHGVVMHCAHCRTDYSATRGDYSAYPEDHVFMCCGDVMTLGRLQQQCFVPLDYEPDSDPEIHWGGCVCADCSGATLSTDND